MRCNAPVGQSPAPQDAPPPQGQADGSEGSTPPLPFEAVPPYDPPREEWTPRTDQDAPLPATPDWASERAPDAETSRAGPAGAHGPPPASEPPNPPLSAPPAHAADTVSPRVWPPDPNPDPLAPPPYQPGPASESPAQTNPEPPRSYETAPSQADPAPSFVSDPPPPFQSDLVPPPEPGPEQWSGQPGPQSQPAQPDPTALQADLEQSLRADPASPLRTDPDPWHGSGTAQPSPQDPAAPSGPDQAFPLPADPALAPSQADPRPVTPSFHADPEPPSETGTAQPLQTDPVPPYQTGTAPLPQVGSASPFHTDPEPSYETGAAQSLQPAPEPYPSNPAPPSHASLPAPFQADPAPPFQADPAPPSQASLPAPFQAGPAPPFHQDPASLFQEGSAAQIHGGMGPGSHAEFAASHQADSESSMQAEAGAPYPGSPPAPFYMPEEAPPQHASPLQTDPLPPHEAQPGQSFQGSAAPAQGEGEYAERPTESIVPDSWFAEPRRTGPREYEQPAQQWTPQPAPAGAEVDPWAPQPGGWGGQPQHTELLQSFPEGPGFAGSRAAPGRGQANKALIIGVAGLVAIALLALGLVMWPDDSPKADANASPSTRSQSQKTRSGPAREQATAVNALLNASAASRGELGRALAASRRCEGIPAAIGGMQRVAEQRRQQFSRARAMRVSALQNGPRLRSTLARSIRLSLDVDQAFLTWAQGASRKCKKRPRPDGHFRRGNALSAQASVAKQRFAALWAPVARKEGLRPRTATQF